MRLSNLELSREFDWSGYISEHHTFKRSGRGEYRVCCVSCGDQDFKLYVNPEKGVFNCFKCAFRSGAKYSVVDFVALTENIPRASALQRLHALYRKTAATEEDIILRGLSKQDQDAADSQRHLTPLAGLPSGLKPLLGPPRGPYWEYLLGRGLTEQEVLAGRVHYPVKKNVPIYNENGKYVGNLASRVVWPIYGQGGKLMSYQARIITPGYDKGDKYLAAPGTELARLLWPYVPPKNGRAYLVEGILDAYAGHRCGYSYYSCFGKKVSIEQIRLLKSWDTQEVVVFFDKKDAYHQIVSAVETLKVHFPKVYVLDVSSWDKDLDPGDCLTRSDQVLKDVSEKLVDVYSLQYAKWKVEIR